MKKEIKEYLKHRILKREEQIKLIEGNLINSLKNDINLCKNILRDGELNLELLEKRTMKLNKYINDFLKLKGGKN